MNPWQRTREVAVLFLKLGVLAFGGPAAHIAMMEDEVVTRRQWLTRAQLLDLIGATNLIPGPNSTELAIHIGYQRAGWRGLLVAGACFITPAMLMVWLLAMVYVHYQTTPQLGWVLYGVKPVIIAVVVQAMWRLGRTAIRDVATGAACVGVIVLAMMGLPPIILLVFAGMDIMFVANRHRLSASQHLLAWLIPFSAATPAQAATSATPTAVGLASLFGVFLKIGAVLYGSGYVLLAFLHSDLVERWHWLSAQQLLDAVAIGQVTPGPVLTTATFLGYMLAGHLGALVATLGIFLPSFCFVALVNPIIPRLRSSKWASGFLDGVIAGSLGLMAVVTWKLASTTLTDWLTGTLALLSAVALSYFRVNTTWLVGGGAMVGLIVHLVGL